MKTVRSAVLGLLLGSVPAFAYAAPPVAAPVPAASMEANAVAHGGKPAPATAMLHEHETMPVRVAAPMPMSAAAAPIAKRIEIGPTVNASEKAPPAAPVAAAMPASIKIHSGPANGQSAPPSGPELRFPNVPQSMEAKAGDQIHVSVAKQDMYTLQPGGTSHDGPAIFWVQMQYKVDGGPVQSVVVASPHSTGQGGYSGTMPMDDASFVIPAGAKSIDYWFVGSAARDVNMYGGNIGPSLYWSNYGQNFKIAVKP